MMKGKRKKGGKGGKINKGKIYDKICYFRGKKYTFPQSVHYLLGGKKYILEKRGGGV